LSSQEAEEASKVQNPSEPNRAEPNKIEPGKGGADKPETGKPDAGKDQTAPASAPSVEVLKGIAKRWPDFAPGRLALARALLHAGAGEEAVKPLSKDAERAIAELNAYTRLAPYDPRPWRDLATAYEQFDRLDDP